MQQSADQNAGPTQGNAGEAVAPPRACRACSAPMQDGQDWCLSCGTAAPGRLGSRPGWRTVNSVAALTLVLITGAVAASYAALSGDSSSKAGQPAPANVAPIPDQVAQVPAAPAPAPATPATTAPTTSTPSTTPVVPATPVAPVTPVVPVTPTTTATTPTTTTPATTTTTPTTTTPATTTTDQSTPTTPAVTLTKIQLGADAMAKYDPSVRITRSTDPADAYDGNKTTAWSVTTPDDGFPMQVGLLVDLESPKTVKQLNLTTTTPGGRVEVYGAAGSALPPDILDTRWEHVASRSSIDETAASGNVKGDNLEKIRLLQGGGKFRYVLVWFTTPPKASPTARVAELDLLG
ncbi:MAG: hypothetical protein JWO02_2931 [Solirubrobacterales bacterium]|nr:hypothetical protein [Solirubrobacterales bacterium]